MVHYQFWATWSWKLWKWWSLLAIWRLANSKQIGKLANSKQPKQLPKLECRVILEIFCNSAEKWKVWELNKDEAKMTTMQRRKIRKPIDEEIDILTWLPKSPLNSQVHHSVISAGTTTAIRQFRSHWKFSKVQIDTQNEKLVIELTTTSSRNL